MRSRPYSLLALVLVLIVGMGCNTGITNSNSSGSGGDPSLYGTWTLNNSTGGIYPPQIVLNAGGEGRYLWPNGTQQTIYWSQSGSSVSILSGNNPNAIYINNLTYPVGNTFTLNGVSGYGVYNR
jgi:hypothetical protein